MDSAIDTPVVELRAVTKSYRAEAFEVKAVRGIDAVFAKREFAAIMGASGSGKSTLMNILGCLDKPTSGEYLFDGVNVSGLDRRELAALRNKKIGFVFQNFNLLARTSATENVELPLLYAEQLGSTRVRRQRAIQALERVGLGDRLEHTPSQLSGGQQQRVAIARALVNEPQLLLADEPTGNLDSDTSGEIMRLFQQFNDSGLAIIMITHESDIAAYARRTIGMRDGTIRSDVVNTDRRLGSGSAAHV